MSKHVITDLSARTKLLSHIVKGQEDATFRFATYTDGKPNPDEVLGNEILDVIGDREATINALADGKQLSAFALAGPEEAVSGALGQFAPFGRFDHGGAHWAVIPVSDADSSLVDALLGVLPNDVDATEFIPLPSTGAAIEFGPDVALSSGEVMEALGLRGLSAESGGGVWKLNDAEVHGEISDAILNTPVRIAIGNSQEEKKWKVSEEAPFGLLLDPFLTTHKVGKKNGACFVTGALVGADRRKNAVTSLYMIGLDVDSGASLDKTFAQIKSMGLFVVAYTTHSHRTTEIRIKQDKYWKWCEKTGNDGNVPTTETVREFLKTETQYVNDVIESARYVEIVHDRDGMNLAIETRPIDKFRLIFLLEEPYVIAEQKMAQRDAILQWERMVIGLGQMLGIDVDRAARDPSRLFFYPRHPKGATNFKILVNGSGRKLDWREIKQVEPHNIGKRRASDDPFESAAEAMDDRKERIITKDGFDLKKWAAQRGDGFMISEVLKDHADDRLRAEIQPGKFVCECPFDEEHSNSGDPEDKGCYVEDAGGSVEQFQFRCSHNSCSGRDRLAMLSKAIDDGWFDGEVLYDARYDCVDRGEAEEVVELPERYSFLRDTGYRISDDGHMIVTADGDPVCQVFEVDGHYEDASGDNATLWLKFVSKGKTKVRAIERADLYGYGNAAIRDLAAMNFVICEADDTLELLRRIDPPLSGQWVNRRGWHDDAFLTIGGETIKPEGSSSLTMRMRETTRKDSGPKGTLEGWNNAIAPVWEDNAKGREHLALAIMIGMAGPVFGRCHPHGFRMLSLHGPTSRGKSLASKLLASASGVPLTDGCYINLRATDNGVEAMLPDLSGHAIALDEGQHMKADVANSLVFMLEAGAGKVAATADRGAREVRKFGGLALLANEKPWATKLKDAGVDVSPGFDARVLDINIAGVDDYPIKEATPLTDRLHRVLKHNGHALPLIVTELLGWSPERLSKIVARLTAILVGRDALGLESRALEVLAWTWLGGMLGRRVGLIPSAFDIRRVIEWARDNRVAEASRPVSERVLSALRTSIARQRRIDLYRWETFDPDAVDAPVLGDEVERVYRPPAGYFYKARDGEELIILADALRGMAGNICSETEIAQYLREEGVLRMSGKNLFHDKLPQRDGHAEKVKNYRIRSEFYLLSAGHDVPRGDEDA